MKKFGFVRVGTSNIELSVGNTKSNTEKILEKIDEAVKEKIDILCFPELTITGYTCNDLFFQDVLIEESYLALNIIKEYTLNKDIVVIVGSIIKEDNYLLNCGVVLNDGKYLGAVAKTFIPNYKEFYEKRWFASGRDLKKEFVIINDEIVEFGKLIFKYKNISFGIEICEDLWNINPPSSDLCLNGANIIFNLSASNEVVGKNEYRKDLIRMASAKGRCAYVYVSSNASESTTDLLFSGASLIYENGLLLKEGNRFKFEGELNFADIDVDRLNNERVSDTNFASDNDYRIVEFSISDKNQILNRKYSKTPFVSDDMAVRKQNCYEILNIQSMALAKRLKHINAKTSVLGLSGGLDSTLALLVVARTYQLLKIDPKNIICVTMPGFGTTDRTYDNALKLAKIFNTTLKEISIKEAVITHFKDIEHDLNVHDVTYENSQARERTQILMDIANKYNGIVVGTGDLSELALGWCTYNGDQMSNYGVNASIPKTLVKHLIEYFKEENPECKEVLNDILNTPISPELLPPDSSGNIAQMTEDSVGPYILHDFFIYHFLRYNAKPSKIFYLASNTFKDDFSDEIILKWLKVFIKRFFTQQFKRSCMPDGVKVGSVSLSPRGDLKMPSDADYVIWLKDLERIKL